MVAGALLALLAGAAPAAVLTVSNGNDSGTGSLRAALAGAANGDSIVFDPSVTQVLLASQLTMTTSVSVNGPGVTLDGQLKGRVLQVNAGASVILRGLIVTHGLLAGKGIDWKRRQRLFLGRGHLQPGHAGARWRASAGQLRQRRGRQPSHH